MIELRKDAELRKRYVISDLIGRGAFATVWRATDKLEGRRVAIKRLAKTGTEDIDHLLAEARHTAKLKGHKNIVEMYAVFEEDDEPFLVMESATEVLSTPLSENTLTRKPGSTWTKSSTTSGRS